MYSLSSDGTLLAWRYEQDAINKQNNLAAPAKKRALKAAKEAANASKRNKKQLEKDAGSQQTEQEQEEEEQKGASPESGHEGDDDGSAERRRSGSLAGPSSSAIIPASATTSTPGLEAAGSSRFPHLAGGKWILHEKHYFNQRGARVSSYDFHAASGMLCIGFTNGVFDLYQLPDFSNVHTLSIGRQRISSVAFNQSGDWIAVGCAKLGQLLVWEWRSETYVLKQQGHYFDISAVTFSPDGSLIATGKKHESTYDVSWQST